MFKWFSLPVETSLGIIFNPYFGDVSWDPTSRLQFSIVAIAHFIFILFLGLHILDLVRTFLLVLGMSVFYWELFKFCELFINLKKV